MLWLNIKVTDASEARVTHLRIIVILEINVFLVHLPCEVFALGGNLVKSG